MTRTLIFSLIALVLLLAITLAGYVAWDRGLLENNPSALTTGAMEPAVIRHLKSASASSQEHFPCLKLNVWSPKPDIEGLPGLQQYAVPGEYAITVLPEVAPKEQPLRDKQIQYYQFFESLGFLTRKTVTVETPDGIRVARQYQLTSKGYAASRRGEKNSPL